MIELPALGGRNWNHEYENFTITVHPFYRPDFSKTFSTTSHYYKAGENRTKHTTNLGAAVGEMIEALGGVNDA